MLNTNCSCLSRVLCRIVAFNCCQGTSNLISTLRALLVDFQVATQNVLGYLHPHPNGRPWPTYGNYPGFGKDHKGGRYKPGESIVPEKIEDEWYD